MNIALWILQVLLAAYFLWHGWLFVAPPAEFVEMMNSSIAPGFRIFVGVAELLAAAGVVGVQDEQRRVVGVARAGPLQTAARSDRLERQHIVRLPVRHQ